MSGLDLLTAVRSNATFGKLPVILMLSDTHTALVTLLLCMRRSAVLPCVFASLSAIFLYGGRPLHSA
jgi:hypothetical protein